MALSRRELLKGFGIGAATLGLGMYFSVRPQRVTAQAATASVRALNRFTFGEWTVTAIQDGVAQLPANLLGANVDEATLTEFLTANRMPTDFMRATITVMLIEAGDEVILMDTGNGAGETSGSLNPTLEVLGLAPEDITQVILSHYHPDHILGAGDMSSMAYPSARYHISQPEWDYLQQDASGTPFAEIVGLANGILAPALAADQLAFYDDGDDLITGVQALATPGHSPGHMGYQLSSGGQTLLVTVDSAINAVASLQNPGWYFGFDADPALAVETRTALFGRAADEGLLTFGYHFPFPGIGYIERAGEGFRFIPAQV
jgi:glyoxylase-like metal-dependent hydrolase (beta-lactamase superfamily II)